ncbi:MAG TPA: tetratricopeptide repeat protein [Pirellulales bacterium]|nr:tetratricopeptide repeat protein [Pirellulales bacterium]
MSVVAVLLLASWSAVVYAHRPGARFSRTEAAMEENDIERLQYMLLELRDSPGYESQASLVTAKILLAEGRPDPALIKLEVAAQDPDTQLAALNLTGEALYRIGNIKEAGNVWNSVVDCDRDNVVALTWLGIAYYDLGAMREAVQYLGRAAALAPTDAGPHRLMGLIWKQLGKYSDALEAFQESLRRNPHQADAMADRYEIAECLHFLKRHDEALEVLAGFEPSPDALALRAHCERAAGQIDEAWKTAGQALQLNPHHVGALLLQASIANEQKRPDDAIARWVQVTEVEPCNREAHYQLAMAYQRMGRAADAEREHLASEELVELQDEQQRTMEVAATSPHDIDARIKLGSLCERLQKYRAAREWYRAAVYLDPQNEVATNALVRLLRQNASANDRAGQRQPGSGVETLPRSSSAGPAGNGRREGTE